MFNKYQSTLLKLYNRYSGKFSMPGRPNFMSIEEFISLINDSQVLINESGVGNGELGAQFNLSMMTQINEVDRDRHFQMMFNEFCEAIARVACKIQDFPDLNEQFYSTNEETKSGPAVVRNRGSSIDTSSDDENTNTP